MKQQKEALLKLVSQITKELLGTNLSSRIIEGLLWCGLGPKEEGAGCFHSDRISFRHELLAKLNEVNQKR